MTVVATGLRRLRVGGVAVFYAATGGVQCVLEIDEDFEAVLLQVINRLACHAQVLFRRGLKRPGDIEQARLNHDDRDRNAVLVAEHELRVGPVSHLNAAATGATEKGEASCAGVD